MQATKAKNPDCYREGTKENEGLTEKKSNPTSSTSCPTSLNFVAQAEKLYETIMEKINIPEIKLTGIKLKHKTTNENGQSSIDCGSLWQKFENENYVERISDKSGDEIYAVYFEYEGDHTKPFSYFIGCKVKMDAEVPQEMDQLIIPAGSYTKVVAKGKMPDCVANAWRDIWSSIADRAYKYDFEIYDDRSKDWSNAEVELFISL